MFLHRLALRVPLARSNSTAAPRVSDVVERSIRSSPSRTASAPTNNTEFTPWLQTQHWEKQPKTYRPIDFHRSNRVVSPLKRNRRSALPAAIDQTAAEAKASDPFMNLGIDLKKEFRNPHLLSAFVTDMGMIKHRNHTGLTWASQKKLTKAVKRARAMGVIPRFSKPRPPPGVWN